MLYTGPFGPMARTVWVQKAKEWIRDGKGESFLFILPTSTLLKSVRDQLLLETGGMSEIHLMAFDDIAQEIVQYADPYAKMLTNYELRRFYDRFLDDTIRAYPWAGWRDELLHDEVRQTIIRSISEMKRSGMTLEQAERIASSPQYSPKHQALAQLLIRSDLELETLSQENGYTCLTYEARLERASRYLSAETPIVPPWLRKVQTIWVDHFTDFFPLQFQLLLSLIQLTSAQNTGIYLPYEHELYEEPSSSLFAERRTRRKGGLANHLERTVKQLRDELGFIARNFSFEDFHHIQKEIADDWNVSHLEASQAAPRQEIWRLPKVAFSPKQPKLERTAQPFAMIPCASERKEAEMVAKLIKQQLLNDESLAPSDFAVIVRDKKQAAAWLHPVFKKEKIPLRLRIEQKISDLPLFQQLNALLHLKASNWSRDCLLKIADGAYMDWNRGPSATFIRWAKERGAREGEQKWRDALNRDCALLEQKRLDWGEMDDEEIDVERLRQNVEHQLAQRRQDLDWLTELNDRVSFIQETNTLEGHAQAIEQFLDVWDIPCQLAALYKEKEEYELAWLKRDLECAQIIQKTLRQLWTSAEKLGELRRRMSFRQFLIEWEEQWQEEMIAIDKGHDGGVACFEPTAARGMHFARVYILGCNEGVFPLKHREQWLLDDAERLLLQENGTLIASHYHHDMEKMFFIMSIAAAREHVTFTFVSPKTNESMLPSSFLESILKKLPDGWLDEEAEKWTEAVSKKAYAEDPSLISSPEEYGLWVMNKSKEMSDANGHLLRSEWLATEFPHILRGAWIEQTRQFGPFSEWDGWIRDPRAVDQIARLFAPDETVFSISQINEYMSSPLTFFFRRILGVQPIEELGLDVSPMDKGMIQHEALRLFYERHRGERLTIDQFEPLRAELIDLVRDQAKRFAEGTIFEGSALFALETERLADALGNWLEAELTQREKADPNLLPTYFELSFGMNTDDAQSDPASSSDVIEITLTNERMRLRGKIDRVDLDPEGNFAIFDYKSSLARYKNYLQFADDTFTFQLPIYLKAMQQWLRANGVSEPKIVGGAFYSVGLNDHGKRQGIWDEERKKLLGLDGKTKSYPIEEKIADDLRRVEDALRRLRQGRFYLSSESRPHPYYADNALYRYDPITVKHKEMGGSDEK